MKEEFHLGGDEDPRDRPGGDDQWAGADRMLSSQIMTCDEVREVGRG